MEKCQLCDFTAENFGSLTQHLKHVHGLRRSDYILKIKYDGIIPLCQCGCGTEMVYNKVLADFPKYIKKHLHIIQEGKSFEEIWGVRDNEMYKKVSKTRKDKFASGEYEHVREAIIEGRKDPKLGAKISKGAKGIPKPKPEGFGVGRIQSEATKQKMSDTAIKNIIITDRNHTSKLEKTFANILDLLNIPYAKFLYAKPIKAFYDFYLEEHNLIIEVDGDFWHCNPNTKFAEPAYDTQRRNIIRDKEKEEWAKDNGYKLIRIWENDINNNIQKVKQLLLEVTK